MVLLQESLLKLVNSDVFYYNFMKEVNQKTLKYNPYRQKEDQIIWHKWPIYEEYQEWIERYVLEDD